MENPTAQLIQSRPVTLNFIRLNINIIIDSQHPSQAYEGRVEDARIPINPVGLSKYHSELVGGPVKDSGFWAHRIQYSALRSNDRPITSITSVILSRTNLIAFKKCSTRTPQATISSSFFYRDKIRSLYKPTFAYERTPSQTTKTPHYPGGPGPQA